MFEVGFLSHMPRYAASVSEGSLLSSAGLQINITNKQGVMIMCHSQLMYQTTACSDRALGCRHVWCFVILMLGSLWMSVLFSHLRTGCGLMRGVSHCLL